MQSSKKNQPKQQQPKRKQKPKQNRVPKTIVLQATNAPVAKGVKGRVPNPRFSPGKRGNVIVRHSELLGNVSSSSDNFTALSYPINPGMTSFTPWLSNVATNYESYRFKTLRLKYVPACPTTQAGQVYLSADFDASDPLPTVENQLANYEGTTFSSPWSGQDYRCTQENLSKRKSYYVRNGSLPAGQDIQLFDTGFAIVATVGTGTNQLGKLWVEYEVELMTPDSPLTQAGKSLSGKLSAANNFTSITQIGNLPVSSSVAGNILTVTSLQPFSGLAGISVTGTGITSTTAGGTGSENVRQEVVNAGGTALNSLVTLSFTAPNQTFTLAITATSVASVNIRVGQYDVAVNG